MSINGKVIASATNGKSFDEPKFNVSGWGYRHQQSLVLFCTLTIAYSMRSCMGVALVAMTHHSVHSEGISESLNVINDHNKSFENVAGIKNVNYNGTEVDVEEFKVQGFFNALMITPPYPVFKWSKKVQDTVISSFFLGYMALQIPAGQLAHRFGAKYLLTGAMFINCVVSIILPLATYYGGWICTIICRILQGLSQACIIPSMHTFFGKWAPLEERGRLTSLAYGGQAFGTVLGLPITGFISSSSMGWPGIFRFYGVLSGISGAILWWLAADTPARHPKISTAERMYIENALGHTEGYEKRKLPIPWRKIMRSPAVYAIIVAHTGSTWGQVVLYSEVPSYMDKIMGLNIKANGLLTALPFMVMWLTNFFFSWLTDMLIVKKVISVTNTRKLANSLGCIPAAVGFVLLAFAPKNIYVVETLLVIICAFKIAANLGYQVNHIDISPNFAGTMMSLSNFFSNLVASLAPIVTGLILTDVRDEHLWRQVFFVAAGMYLVTNTFYLVFGAAELAEWNEPPKADIGTETGTEAESMPILKTEETLIVASKQNKSDVDIDS